MGHKTTYTYGTGSTGNPLLANDLLTITAPTPSPAAPTPATRPSTSTTTSGRVTAQTDPMGFKTTFNYCVNAAAGDCMNAATGSGYVTVADPDGNSTVYDYDQGTLAAKTVVTGSTVTSEQDNTPDITGRRHQRRHPPGHHDHRRRRRDDQLHLRRNEQTHLGDSARGERPAVHDDNGVHQPGQPQL